MISDWKDWTPEMVEAHNRKVRGLPVSLPETSLPKTGPPYPDDYKKTHGPNKTEALYGYMLKLESGYEPSFEGLTFKLKNGHKYTPDWVVVLPDCRILCVEVKARGRNGFRQPSYQRARVMFDQCRVEWPNYTWRWAERFMNEWIVKNY